MSKSSSKYLLTLMAVAALSACGGGGSDTVVQLPALVTPYSQTTVKNVAGLGLLIVRTEASQVQNEQAFFALTLKSVINSSTGGSIPSTTASCASNGAGGGSFTLGITKSGVYAGLRANDTVSLLFSACDFGGTGSTASPTLNGAAVLTSKNTYSSLPAAFSIQYDVATTNFDLISSASKLRSNGIQAVTFDATVAGTGLPEINVVAGSTGYSSAFFSPATASAANLTNTLKSGGAIYSKLGAGSTFISGVNGIIDVLVSSGALSFTLATNTRLSGSNASGAAVPTAGNLSTKDNALNLQTVTTIQGSNATVQADTNQDGSLDSTVTTPYVFLII